MAVALSKEHSGEGLKFDMLLNKKILTGLNWTKAAVL